MFLFLLSSQIRVSEYPTTHETVEQDTDRETTDKMRMIFFQLQYYSWWNFINIVRGGSEKNTVLLGNLSQMVDPFWEPLFEKKC